MRNFPSSALAAVTILIAATASFGQAPQPPGPREPYGEAEQAAGREVFLHHCLVCHVLRRGPRGYGPTLYGVVGRPAGAEPGFPYSDALKKSGLVWTEENLRKWIADNAVLVPGERMPHVSISDPAEQVYLIAFLRTLKARPGEAAPR
jgi:cytochrome c